MHENSRITQNESVKNQKCFIRKFPCIWKFLPQAKCFILWTKKIWIKKFDFQATTLCIGLVWCCSSGGAKDTAILHSSKRQKQFWTVRGAADVRKCPRTGFCPVSGQRGNIRFLRIEYLALSWVHFWHLLLFGTGSNRFWIGCRRLYMVLLGW